MICPHCGRTIREEDRYLMSARPPGEELSDSMKSLGRVGLYAIAFVVCVGLFAVARAHGL